MWNLLKRATLVVFARKIYQEDPKTSPQQWNTHLLTTIVSKLSCSYTEPCFILITVPKFLLIALARGITYSSSRMDGLHCRYGSCFDSQSTTRNYCSPHIAAKLKMCACFEILYLLQPLSLNSTRMWWSWLVLSVIEKMHASSTRTAVFHLFFGWLVLASRTVRSYTLDVKRV